jgi:hypothetical protein
MNDDNNRIKYVTKINRENKCAFWADGEPAMTFTKTIAEDYVYGLVVNGFNAVVIKAPSFIELCNGSDKDDD